MIANYGKKQWIEIFALAKYIFPGGRDWRWIQKEEKETQRKTETKGGKEKVNQEGGEKEKEG